jgi:uncharacterized membrane protein
LAEGTSRLEAFSDGVFAIAITLLILEIKVPHAGPGGLWASLRALWPSYAAFALSFFVILVTWITHHDLIRLCADTSRPMQLANGLALLYVTFIPFPTAVLAEHLGGPEMKTAVALYCGTFVFGSAAVNLLVATMMRGKLCNPEVDLPILRKVRHAFRFTFTFYLATTFMALWLPWAALGLNIAVRLYLLSVRYHLTAHAAEPAAAVLLEGDR